MACPTSSHDLLPTDASSPTNAGACHLAICSPSTSLPTVALAATARADVEHVLPFFWVCGCWWWWHSKTWLAINLPSESNIPKFWFLTETHKKLKLKEALALSALEICVAYVAISASNKIPLSAAYVSFYNLAAAWA